jgi:glycerophosphoryl diester phosphodiesterase
MNAERKMVIAHRGASGYLPEHSLPAKAMAYAMGADFLEQDLVMTKDDHLVVLHDHYLDRVTDVASQFPHRKRDDGRYYALDFTLAEIKSLKMTEGFKIENGKIIQNFPRRFPIWKSSFQVNTFEEELEFIQGLNKSSGKNIGIYPEIKSPAFHRAEGKDISRRVLETLKRYGYTAKTDNIYLQCFNPLELRRIKKDLFPEFNVELKTIQLLPEEIYGQPLQPERYLRDRLADTMKEISEYADGIGPDKSMIVKKDSAAGNLEITSLTNEAHKAGLEVHPYTFRLDEDELPPYAESFEDLLDIFYCKIGVDAVFTDFPDRAVNFLRKRTDKKNLSL